MEEPSFTKRKIIKNDLLLKKLSVGRVLKKEEKKNNAEVHINAINKNILYHDKKKKRLVISSIYSDYKYNLIEKFKEKSLNIYDIKKIRNGDGFYLILLENNDLYTIGNNIFGQCGVDPTITNRVNALNKINIPNNEKIKDISCSTYSSFFLLENNDVYAFGYIIKENFIPQKITLLEDVKIKKIIENSTKKKEKIYIISENNKIYKCNALEKESEETEFMFSKVLSPKDFNKIIVSKKLIYICPNNIIKLKYGYIMSSNILRNLHIDKDIKGKIIQIIFDDWERIFVLTSESIYLVGLDEKKKSNPKLFLINELTFFNKKNIIHISIGKYVQFAISKDRNVYIFDVPPKLTNPINVPSLLGV